MARLHKSPSLSSSSTSPETARQQLHTGPLTSQASSAPLSSAVHGASLLNAARSSKPTDVTRTAKGKLPRPTLKFGTTTKKPALRANPYDVPDSPVEGTFQLPEVINPTPLKVRGRNKKTKGDIEGRSEAFSEPQEAQSELIPYTRDEDEQRIPTSPPTFAEDTNNDIHVGEDKTDGTKRRLEDETDPRDRTSKSPRLQEPDVSAPLNRQKALSSPLTQNHTSRPSRRSHPEIRIPLRASKTQAQPTNEGAADERSDENQHGDGRDTIEVAIPDSSTTTNHKVSRRQATNDTPSTSVPDIVRQQGEDDASAAVTSKPSVPSGQKKSRRQATQVSDSTSSRTQSLKTSQKKADPVAKPQKDSLPGSIDDAPVLGNGDNDNGIEDDDVFEIEQELEGDKQNRKVARSRRVPTSTSVPSTSSKDKKTRRVAVPKPRTKASQRTAEDGQQTKSQSANDAEQGPAEGGHEENDAEEALESEDASLSNLDLLFKFLDAEERSGQCETKLGTQIKRVCDRACSLISEETDSISVIVEKSNDIRAMLGRINSLEADRQVAFKSDAYSYLFRALTLYFEAAHGCLSKHYDDVAESLPAVQILHSLAHDILTFKAWLATWNVSVPQYQKGDRLIKDVETKLIVPLRKVEKMLRIRLSALEVAERKRRMRLELERKREEEIAKQDYLAARRERRKRWQDLHIARMQCEPDLSRRRKLFFVELDDLEETDANGVKFERIPLFKDRVTPRVRSTTSEQHEWADEQTAVLIEALEKFTGPHVFEKLFHAHCRPDGMLRDFTVTDITAKAAWVRSAYLKLHQERQDKGWEVPDWVKKIPVLP